MGQFDQTARDGIKDDPEPFFQWAQTCFSPPPKLRFVRWDDTRRLVAPGEADRTNDLVAWFIDEDSGRDVALITEVEEECKAKNLLRMAAYEILLAQEVNPECDPAGPLVGSMLINLTGTQKFRRWENNLAGGQHGTRVAPFVIDLVKQDGPETLERIKSGELGLSVLPWLAIMQGSESEEFLREWFQVAQREQVAQRRERIGDMTLVLAELARCQLDWLDLLRDWQMRESSWINTWRDQGIDIGSVRAKRGFLVEAIKVRLADPVPENISKAIEGTTSSETLDRWFEAALKAQVLSELRAAMKMDPPDEPSKKDQAAKVDAPQNKPESGATAEGK
jgi:hypothetical protein